MSKFFYSKLAVTNIRKNGKTYFPYLLTCVCTVMMFYIMHAMAHNPGFEEGGSVRSMLGFGVWVIGIFAAIFLFYTNSFLIKRRKKELGLYNILGLEKKHIAKMLFFETLFIAFASLVLGLAGGVLLSKLMYMLLLRLLNFGVSIAFHIAVPSLLQTAAVFALIFLATLVTNLLRIHLSNPIELLHGGQHGEREPKTKKVMTIAGLLALAGGYGIAISVKSPLEAFGLFFAAVLLVIAGTYALFTAGSVSMLKLLRKNKNYYYQTKHFTSVSGLLYRMKQNAVGLANICILSTMVLVTLSTTVSMYIGQENLLQTRFPHEVSILSTSPTPVKTAKLNQIIGEQAQQTGLEPQNLVQYRYSILIGEQGSKQKDTFKSLTGQDNNAYRGQTYELYLVPLADYNKIVSSPASLQPGQALAFSLMQPYGQSSFSFAGQTFAIKEELAQFPGQQRNESAVSNRLYLVLPDEETIAQLHQEALNGEEFDGFHQGTYFDLPGTPDEKTLFERQLQIALDAQPELESHPQGREQSRMGFYLLYGGLFFLGIFLGALFLMATVLIIYYKQISEGMEDKERFEIMQKVGMSKKEIKKTIHSQILLVFFLPLAAAICHIAFAFPMITKLLTLLNLSNVSLFLVCTLATIGIFALIYALVYGLTAKVYYKIVN